MLQIRVRTVMMLNYARGGALAHLVMCPLLGYISFQAGYWGLLAVSAAGFAVALVIVYRLGVRPAP